MTIITLTNICQNIVHPNSLWVLNFLTAFFFSVFISIKPMFRLAIFFFSRITTLRAWWMKIIVLQKGSDVLWHSTAYGRYYIALHSSMKCRGKCVKQEKNLWFWMSGIHICLYIYLLWKCVSALCIKHHILVHYILKIFT